MDLLKLIQNNTSVPYAYSYPTTRAYQPLADFDISQATFSPDINLYIHIPFCAQKCSFCGYLTTVSRKEEEYDEYVGAVVREISRSSHLRGRTVKSINFGGGTPMLLTKDQVSRIIEQLLISFPDVLETAEEISIEATPESVSADKALHLRSLGFNRISIGVQTLNDAELAATKRKNFSASTYQAIQSIRLAGIPNLCCDLMYGLPGQTLASWQKTVSELLEYRPETIELYRTVLIPETGLFRINRPSIMSEDEKCHAYETARLALFAAGYTQDSHVRFILPDRGFYKQQANTFKGQSLVGFGAGARSYAQNVHYRNSYGFRDSKAAIQRYVQKQRAGISAVETAVFLDQEERLRRHIIYNLESLDAAAAEQEYGVNVLEEYNEVWTELAERKLITIRNNTISLNSSASYSRDLLAYFFFSEKVKSLEEAYYQK